MTACIRNMNYLLAKKYTSRPRSFCEISNIERKIIGQGYEKVHIL
jgi:hypothetical protein